MCIHIYGSSFIELLCVKATKELIHIRSMCSYVTASLIIMCCQIIQASLMKHNLMMPSVLRLNRMERVYLHCATQSFKHSNHLQTSASSKSQRNMRKERDDKYAQTEWKWRIRQSKEKPLTNSLALNTQIDCVTASILLCVYVFVCNKLEF